MYLSLPLQEKPPAGADQSTHACSLSSQKAYCSVADCVAPDEATIPGAERLHRADWADTVRCYRCDVITGRDMNILLRMLPTVGRANWEPKGSWEITNVIDILQSRYNFRLDFLLLLVNLLGQGRAEEGRGGER